MYNGRGLDPTEEGYPGDYDVCNQHYCQWDDDEKKWKFHRLAYYYDRNGNVTSHNYVGSVCAMILPK